MKILILLLFSISVGINGMQQQESPDTTQAKFQHTEAIEWPLASLNKVTKNGGFIFGDFFLLTNPKLIQLLKEKHTNNVSVDVICCNSQKTRTEKAVNGAFPILYYNARNAIKNEFCPSLANKMHLKTLGWVYTNKKNEKKYRLFTGSCNPTNMNNTEIMMHHIDKEMFDQKYELHEILKNSLHQKMKLPTSDQKQILHITPVKEDSINSLQYNLTKSIAERLNNCKPNDNYYLMCYSFNDLDLKQAVLKAAHQGAVKGIIVDPVALEKSDYLLRNLHTEFNVPVFVYNFFQTKKRGNYPALNHIKALIRSNEDGRSLVICGSANFTKESNSDINDLNLYPNDQKMTEQCIKEFELLKNESTPIAKIPAIEQKNTKRKINFELHNQHQNQNKKLKIEPTELTQEKIADLYKTNTQENARNFMLGEINSVVAAFESKKPNVKAKAKDLLAQYSLLKAEYNNWKEETL